MNSSGGVWVPILVAIVTAFATVITVYLTGRANLRLEREKFKTNSQLERQKFESSLVLQAIATGEQEAARKNLDFLVKAGFLPDPENQIKELANEPEDTPVLPSRSPVERPSQAPVFRWPVRTGADADASLVKDTPVPITVEELVAQPRPAGMQRMTLTSPTYQNRRAEGVERTVYQLEGDIVGSQLMASGNYHLNLQGVTGQTMIANCPDPDPRIVDPSSRWAKQIAVVRSRIQKRLEPGARKHHENERVRITGVGFFNHVHGQWGVAPNGIELTPVLSIEWLSSSAALGRAGRSKRNAPRSPVS